MDVSRSPLFRMKNRVCLKYFVSGFRVTSEIFVLNIELEEAIFSTKH